MRNRASNVREEWKQHRCPVLGPKLLGESTEERSLLHKQWHLPDGSDDDVRLRMHWKRLPNPETQRLCLRGFIGMPIRRVQVR